METTRCSISQEQTRPADFIDMNQSLHQEIHDSLADLVEQRIGDGGAAEARKLLDCFAEMGKNEVVRVTARQMPGRVFQGRL